MNLRNLGPAKIFAATVTVFGILFGLVDKLLAPDVVISDLSPPAHEWVGWLAFLAASLEAIGYVLIDLLSSKGN